MLSPFKSKPDLWDLTRSLSRFMYVVNDLKLANLRSYFRTSKYLRDIRWLAEKIENQNEK